MSTSLYAALCGKSEPSNEGHSPLKYEIQPVWVDMGKYDKAIIVGEKHQPKPLPELPEFSQPEKVPLPVLWGDFEKAPEPNWVDRFMVMMTPAKSTPQRRFAPESS
eukprot:TRINITY_DN11771_c0_g1_i1.p1 TRINITY_DN11771_c0_g1~~TRINITY_DN11771_c0_g1_i1.p1  ORF type:complete len:106 (+),score=17.87 TRINITY_DN11771_c0_g1_i1:2-319(+)